jgi:hypothetical protein
MEQFKPIQEHNIEAEQKQLLWNNTMEQIDRIVDGLGHPIDAGIKETVAAFMVNNFPTNGSCEGHVEERFGRKIKLSPYINIGIELPKYRYVDEDEIRNRFAKEYNTSPEELGQENNEASRAYWDYLDDHDVLESPDYLEIRKENEELKKSMLSVLEKFYKEHHAADTAELVVRGIGPGGHFRVTTGNETVKGIDEADLDKYQKQLLVEQEEIKNFTSFLKENFFEKTP